MPSTHTIWIIATVLLFLPRCDSVDTGSGNKSHSVTIQLTMDSLAETADIESATFTLTHKQTYYGTTIDLEAQSGGTGFEGQLEDVPEGTVEYEIQVKGSNAILICRVTGTATVSGPSEIKYALGDGDCAPPTGD